MEKYADVHAFRHEIQEDDNKFSQRVMDKFHIQVLQDYRIAAAFVVGMLKTFAMKKGVEEGIDYDRINKYAKAILSGCEEILADGSIYIMNESTDGEISKQLEEAVKKAGEMIVFAGNFCNNNLPLLLKTREEFLAVVYQARDLCDKTTRRISFSGI